MEPFAFTNPGYIPHRDPRNWSLEALQAPRTPESPYVSPLISSLPILMQGKQPSCVAHGVVSAIMYKEMKKFGKAPELSRRFLYALSKKSDGIPNQQGTILDNALKITSKIGVCEERFFPDDISLPYDEYIDISRIPEDAYINASTHKTTSYAFLTDLSYQGLSNAIFQNDIVMTGMDIDSSWWTKNDGTISWVADDILPIRAPNPATSRHLVDLYAFNDDMKLLAGINSWSESWGAKGTFFYYSDEFPYIYEAAVLWI